MATWDFDGVDKYVAELVKLEDYTPSMIGRTVYKGAEVVADDVQEAIRQIPIDDRRYVWSGSRRGITTEQRDGLIEGFGIASMRKDNGFINVKLGFAGYNDVQTKAFPNGEPNLLIARMVESGTSYMPKIGAISKAIQASKAKCESTMKQTFENEIAKTTK